MDVLALLDEKGIPYLSKGSEEYSIHCPNQHNHAGGTDSNPSFNINTTKLVGNCLACGFRLSEKGLFKFLVGGDLDEMQLRALGIRSSLRRIQAESEEELQGDCEEFTLLPPGKPWDQDYRGIPAEFYQKLGARHCQQGYYKNRIVFPIYVEKKLRGFESRDLGKSDLPKYLRSKNFNSLELGLYPYDLVREMKPKELILCEGVFDAINAVSKGYPALNIFGVRTFSMQKLSLILATGCSEVILLLDNDTAGNEAEVGIAEAMKDWVTVSKADKSLLENGKDLGDLSAEEIKECLAKRRGSSEHFHGRR